MMTLMSPVQERMVVHMRRKTISILMLLVFSLVCWVPGARAGEAKAPPELELTKGSVSGRLANVKRLLEVSSGAQRVMESEDPDAQKQREAGLAAYDEAEKAFKKGDYVVADQRLHDATQFMFEAVRIVGAGAVTLEKKLGDYDKRAESVDILLAALERIAAEKKAVGEVADEVDEVKTRVEASRALLEREKVDEARVELDAAYEIAKTSIEKLRGGDTLVRSLNFETKEEEYLYEVDRNDTHLMLITVLLEEKVKSEAVDNMVRRFLEEASKLRVKAEEQADAKDYEAAIVSLEESTSALVRAIRSAGVYIPG